MKSRREVSRAALLVMKPTAPVVEVISYCMQSLKGRPEVMICPVKSDQKFGPKPPYNEILLK